MRKRVTVGFLSIVCLLFFSGMVSFVELSHLSRDTGEIDPFFVEVIRSCNCPISVAKVGW